MVCVITVNSHHLLNIVPQPQYIFGICLCFVLISQNVSNLLQKRHFPISAYFGSLFCYQSNGKIQINTKLLHFWYCSDKLIKGSFL